MQQPLATDYRSNAVQVKCVENIYSTVDTAGIGISPFLGSNFHFQNCILFFLQNCFSDFFENVARSTNFRPPSWKKLFFAI